MGTAAQNREKLTIDRTAFVDCDVQSSVHTGTGTGGALGLTHTQLIMRDSIVTRSDALGSIGDGGAMRILTDSHATIERTTFAENTAGRKAPTLYIYASHADITNSEFYANSTATSENGSVIWSSTGTVPGGSNLGVSGSVTGNVFSENDGLEITESRSLRRTDQLDDVLKQRLPQTLRLDRLPAPTCLPHHRHGF